MTPKENAAGPGRDRGGADSSNAHANSTTFRQAYHRLYGHWPDQPRIARERFPDARDYYSQRLEKLHGGGSWRTAVCPFHDDKSPSLSVNVEHGGYVCHGCGAKGGDVLDFHRAITGGSLLEAARDLGVLEGGNRNAR